MWPALRSLLVVLGVVVALGAAAFLVGDSVRVGSLADWEDASARPGFRLLDSVDAHGFYVCVYHTALDEIAFCYHWHGEGEEPSSNTLAVSDPSGGSVHGEREDSTDLTWKRNFVVVEWSGSDGTVFPLREGYRGRVLVRFDASGPVYARVIDLETGAVEPAPDR